MRDSCLTIGDLEVRKLSVIAERRQFLMVRGFPDRVGKLKPAYF